MRVFLVSVGILSLSVPASAEPERETFETVVDAGLEYLAANQTPEGSWGSLPGKDPAVTALGVMAFLSAGHVPGEGPFGKKVENGIRYVLSQQHRSGLISASRADTEMYHHGICTLMLAEAVGMLPDRAAARRLREKLELAVTLILKAQVRGDEGDGGGWRYTMVSTDADISITGWQLMALRAAKNVGCNIPAAPIERAIAYIKRCHDPVSGGYRYQRSKPVTLPCTGAAVLGLELTDKEHHDSLEAKKAGSLLLQASLDPRREHFFYGIYYTSQAMFQLGDNYWTVYRNNLHELLLVRNPPKAAGYWTGWGWDDAKYGPNYCTAMAILALTVEYRFLPIYQRSEEPAK